MPAMLIWCILLKSASDGFLILSPLIAAFFGKELFLRFHICFCCHAVFSLICSRVCSIYDWLLQLSLIVVYISWPMPFIPSAVVWFYDKLLWTSEPLWQLIEILAAVHLIMKFTCDVLDRQCDHPVKAQVVLVVFGGVCYGLAIWLITIIVSSEVWACKLILLGVLLLSAVAHNLLFNMGDGVISELGFVNLFAVVMVYGMVVENRTNKRLFIPEEWLQASETMPYVNLVLKIISSGIGGVDHVLMFSGHMVTPWFLASAFFRCLAVIYTIESVIRWYHDNDECDAVCDENDDEDSFTTLCSKYSSPLIVRLIVYFVYSQFLVHHIHRSIETSDQHAYHVTQLAEWVVSTACRSVQVCGVFAYYLYKVYQRSDEVDLY